MFDEMLNYVTEYLNSNGGQISQLPFRVRSDHIKRVFMWTNQLIDGVDAPINRDALLTAAAFHDIGYANLSENEPHAENSAKIFLQYAATKDYSEQDKQFIAYLIQNHSNKNMLHDDDAPLELILLIEADLLDETGALSIVWDCMMEGGETIQSFTKTYEHIKNYSGKILRENPLVTKKGKLYWEQKQTLTAEFIKQFAFDIGIIAN